MVIISQNNQISVIILNYDASNMDELLESLNDQTWENLEIICLTEDSSNIKTGADLIVKEFSDFKISDIEGDYLIFANVRDKYYLVGLESLLDYSLANGLELVLYPPINFDMKTKEIYERDLDALKAVSKDVKKEVFSFEDLSKDLFSLNPEISGIFYKKSFLEDFLSDEDFSSPLNNKYLFFKSILNSNKIGIFKKPVYIKKDCSRYEIKNSPLSNEHYYNLENSSIDEIDSLNDKICDLFKKSNQYEGYKEDLANFKMDLYNEFLSNENNDPNEKIKLENKLKEQKQLNEESVGSNSRKLFSPAKRLKKFLKR